jgi:hypothetical protein
MTIVKRALWMPWSGPPGASRVGWSLDRLENWMAAASRALLLDQPS